MRRAFELLQLLSDRAEHSGAELAERLGVTRAAVWNQISLLRNEGIEVQGTRGRGYRLPAGFDALNADLILERVRAAGCAAISNVRSLTVTDSTNERLLAELQQGDIHGHALLAEYQTAGRGRRGDRWISPPGSGLCMSLGWRFDAPPATFSALSLVVGLALVRTLRQRGVGAAMLKWPNDIVCNGAKLAGILIEMRAEAGGICRTVIGMGINVRLSQQARDMIGRPADDYMSTAGETIPRNELAAALLVGLARVLPEFARDGFAPFRADWAGFDALAGTAVCLELPGRVVRGQARGVDDHGALLIEHGGHCETFVSGHVGRA